MRTNKPLLVVLSPGFPKNEEDSACLPMQQLFLHTLAQSYPQWKIVVCALQYPFEKRIYTWKGIEVRAFGGENRGGIHRRLTWWKAWRSLQQLQQPVSAVLSFWYGECAYLGNRFARRAGIPHYCWLLGQDARPGNRFVKSLRLPAASLIALSDFLQQEFDSNYQQLPGHVIPPGLSPLTSRNQVLDSRDVDLLAAGSLIPLKRFDMFIELVHQLRERLPGIRAVLAGEGPERERLEAAIRSRGLEENLKLAGALAHADLLALMRRSRVLVHPSSYEGFPGVCLEALQAGARVVSFFRPMKADLEHWDSVATPDEMMERVWQRMHLDPSSYVPSTPFLMEDTVARMMHLLGQDRSAS